MELQVKDSKGTVIGVVDFSPLLEEVKKNQTSANFLDDTAKLNEDYAKLEEEIANLKGEIVRLESEEHSQDVIAHFLNQDFEDADPAVKAELGRKLGLTKLFEEAEVVEEEKSVAVATVKELAKLEVVWQDPGDSDYKKVVGLPIWLLSKGA